MSRLHKLLLQGIRSFGSDDGDGQIITFFSPLTLILGQNGCGKTTIIEALKVATCGDFPAGGGVYFVNDPKCASKTVSKGHIKLKIVDANGEPIEVNRLMQVTQKAKKPEYKSVEQNIKRLKANGEMSTISGNCSVIDLEMSIAMGVSSAILKYVIFCHQEESSWPLDENKKLKERFDEIFDSAKFNKCFDSIDKLRKSMTSQNNIRKKDLDNLRERWDLVIEKKDTKKKVERQLASIRDEVEALVVRLEPIRKQLEDIFYKESNIGKINVDYMQKKGALSSLVKQKEELRGAITNEFTGSLEELREAIASFFAELQVKEDSLRDHEERLDALVRDETHIAAGVGKEQVKVGQLQAEEEQNRRTVDERNLQLNRMAHDLGVTVAGSLGTQPGDTQVAALLDQVAAKIKEKSRQLEVDRAQLEAAEQLLQSKIDECRDLKVTLETNISTKKQELANTKAECRKVRADIEEVDLSAGQLARLETRLERLNQELDEVSQAVDVDALKRSIKETVERTGGLDERLDAVNKEVQLLQQSAADRAELDINLRKLGERKTEVRKLRSKHDESLGHLLGALPEEGFRFELQSCQDRLARDIKDLGSQLNAKRTEITRLESNRRHQRELLQSKEEELRVNEEAIYESCGSEPFENVLKSVSENIDKLQDQVGTLSASGTLYRRYISKLLQTDPHCPLCSRGFPAASEAADLVAELQAKLREFPARLAESREKLATLDAKYDKLQQLKPTHANIAALREVQLPKIRGELKTVETQLAASKHDAEELEMSRCVPQSDEDLARSLQGDMVLLDQHQTEIKKLSREVEHIEATLPKGASERSMAAALAEQQQLRTDLSVARRSSTADQSRLSSHTEQLQALREQRNALVEERLRVQGGVARRAQLAERLVQLQAAEVAAADGVERAQAEVPAARNKLDEATRKLDAARNKNRASMDKSRTELTQVERKLDDVNSYQRAINNYERRGVADQLAAARNSLAKLKREAEITRQKKEDQSSLIHSVQKLISSQKIQERDLNDNLRLREKDEEIRSLTTVVEELRAQIGSMDYKSLQKEKEKLKTEEDKINEKKHHSDGRRYTLNDELTTLNRELNKEAYRTVEADYTKLLAEQTVSTAACADLQRYSSAMEWALIHFHTERMKAVNRIIRELWRQVYRGNDIDHIEIKTDTTEGVGGKRRTYNYRVVQMKGNAELDMRNRCSAGQKVLACLIIRLALAETFSSACGIIALDEPTTNLDRANIESLSQALVELVNTRMAQKNFQLIVITHDEDFLSSLCQSEDVRFYYKVERSRSGKSVIHKKRVIE